MNQGENAGHTRNDNEFNTFLHEAPTPSWLDVFRHARLGASPEGGAVGYETLFEQPEVDGSYTNPSGYFDAFHSSEDCIGLPHSATNGPTTTLPSNPHATTPSCEKSLGQQEKPTEEVVDHQSTGSFAELFSTDWPTQDEQEASLLDDNALLHVGKPELTLPQANDRERDSQVMQEDEHVRLLASVGTPSNAVFLQPNTVPKIGYAPHPVSEQLYRSPYRPIRAASRKQPVRNVRNTGGPYLKKRPMPSHRKARTLSSKRGTTRAELHQTERPCIRCRLYKEGCGEGTPCPRCRKALSTSRKFDQPCSREYLNKVVPFRAGNSRAGKLRSEPLDPTWTSEEAGKKIVKLAYPFKNDAVISKTSITLTCSKFWPDERDVLVEPWELQNGDVADLESPPYACYNTAAGQQEIEKYLEAHRDELIQESIDEVDDVLIQTTVSEAFRYARSFEDSAVAYAMKICAATHFSKTRLQMTDGNPLDLPYFEDERFHSRGGVPIPGPLDYQIDFFTIQYMLSQTEAIVKRLEDLIFRTEEIRRNAWYEIYLTVFVLLSGLERLHRSQMKMIERWSSTPSRNTMHVQSISARMIQEWRRSARILTYHYRLVPNAMDRFKGPCGEDDVNEMLKLHDFDELALGYVKTMIKMKQDRDIELQRASKADPDDDNATPLAWISRMLIDEKRLQY